ncbi:indole-2-monooxygenase-like isoform X2 [Lolium rigidum]|uniref:indole-2-monooxygenase-like isoform X2 n=1 Tax=Lolium rigidum TaxID=89674 RepID=UPI001F5C5D0A|nr:indole-2-monooxygenase-like isoform X2 [Lolium rigidum]
MAAHLVPLFLTPQALLLYLLLLPLLLLLQRRHYFARGEQAASVHGERPPPSPPSKLPLIGHMHLIGSDPHVSLAALAAKHGESGLMLLRLGQVLNLVVSTPHAAEAVLRTHDHVFANRPHNAFADTLLDGADIAFAPYGEFWRQMRKLLTTHLLSAKKVLSLRHGREEEVRLVIAKIQDAAATGAAVDMTKLLSTYTNDIACRAVSGKFFREEGRNELFREVIDGNVAAFGGFNPQDYFPSLAKVDMLSRVLFSKMHRLRKRWDELLDRIIEDHANRASSLEQQHEDQDADFVDVLLSRQHEYSLTRQHIKAILIDMFVAGTDTSYVVLEFAMAELMRKPHLMAKLQAEVRNNTPKDQQMVTEHDLGRMPYLKAVLKETVRLHPPLPLLLPHLTVETCVIDGLTVPTDTRVIINVWAIGRDAGSWEDSNRKGRDFQLLPFGGGRRICPGINFGMSTVEIMLANLVYCFDWAPPMGMRHEDIDMTDVFGMTVRRKQKLLLVPRSRHVSCS